MGKKGVERTGKTDKTVRGGEKMRIGDIMTRNPVTVDSETSIIDAKSIMKENNIRRLPVVDKGKLVGIVTERMILEASPSPATT